MPTMSYKLKTPLNYEIALIFFIKEEKKKKKLKTPTTAEKRKSTPPLPTVQRCVVTMRPAAKI